MANLSNKLQAYFLGELTEEEVIRLEDEYLGDDAKLAQLREAENDLLDDYVNDWLPPKVRKSFEENYLNSPFRRQRLEFAKSLAEYLPNESVQSVEKKAFAWRDIFSLWKIGTAFASIMLLLLGGFWLMQNSKNISNNEVAVIKTPEILLTPAPETSPIIEKTPIKPRANTNETNPNVSPTPIPISTPKTSVSPPPEKVKPNQTVVLALSTIGMRDGGKTPQAILGNDSKNLVLQLKMAETDAKDFQVKIVNANGNAVYQVKNARISGKTIRVNLSANILKNDDYIVEVFAVNSAGESEKVSGYTFRVIKK